MSREFLEDKLATLRAAGLYRQMRTFDGPPAPHTQLEGREVILMAANAYLGLNTDPRVVAAAQQAIARFGTGSGGSRLISGTSRLHREMEAALAALKGTEDCVLFGTGYQANVGAITALTGPADLILSDELNHASIIDACRLSRARTINYRHGDAEHLAGLLARERPHHRRCLIVTDGVFSMDGDIAPLPAICALADHFEALVMVDDAHATGVLGATGAGSAEHFGLHGSVPVQVGTLSKALASQGGFVAGSHRLCEFLRNRARPFIFSTASTPAAVAAALAALQVLRAEPERLRRLRAAAGRLRAGLTDLGYRVPPGETPILPVAIGAPERAVALATALLAEGLFVQAIRPPAVPPGTSRLRVTVMATHSDADLEVALVAFAAAGRKVGMLP